MTKHTIDIEEDLPEGFTAVELALSDNPADEVINDNGNTMYVKSILKLQKTKPRRIVLEETDEDNQRDNYGHPVNQYIGTNVCVIGEPKPWRIKEE